MLARFLCAICFVVIRIGFLSIPQWLIKWGGLSLRVRSLNILILSLGKFGNVHW